MAAARPHPRLAAAPTVDNLRDATMRSLVLLGSTGSIGTQTLDLLREDPGAHRVVGLAARSSWREVLAQAREFAPRFVALTDESAADELRRAIDPRTHVFGGASALEALVLAADFDVLVHGVVGAAGLLPSLRAIERGKTLALANKESLVVAGAHLVRLARETGASIVPVDSEHSAVFQCLRGESIERVRRVWLTASGGPFRTATRDEMARVSPDMALRHPNWNMGPRITIGSATLMNKALEIIELHHLFGLEPERIGVVIHPQSVVHSMVEFVDGSTIAQASPPTMHIPIALGLAWPERLHDVAPACDWTQAASWDFLPLDDEAFPAVRLARQVGAAGGTHPAVYNAANEVCVAAFHRRELAFPAIVDVVEQVVSEHAGNSGAATGVDLTVDQVLAADAWARDAAAHRIQSLTRV